MKMKPSPGRRTCSRSGPSRPSHVTRTCIIVSPYFPPSTLAGVHRARHLAKHLPAAGWTPIILCVDEAYHEERLDPGLAALVPPNVQIVRAPAAHARLTRPFGIGEISLRAWFPLRAALFQLLETRAIDVVLITGSPFYPMLLAEDIKRRHGIPVILDFQDPWVSAWGSQQPTWSKVRLSHSLATWLEPRALRSADFVTSVSPTQNAEMAARYDWIDRNRMAAIPIGGDPQDYEALRDVQVGEEGLGLTKGYINLSYVGTIWPPVVDTVRTLLRAAARLRLDNPAIYNSIRLNFIGTTANSNDTSGYRVLPLAEAEGVADIVREVPQRIPYLNALSAQAHSDGILMLGSAEPHYTASKIYSVLMSGRPFLSVFHRKSSAHEILLKAGGGLALGFGDLAELAVLEKPLADALAQLATAPGALGQVDRAAYKPYGACAIAQQFGNIFDQLTDEHAGKH